MANERLRHYEPTGSGEPPCGAKDGWWIATARYVTCPECQRHLPKTVHLHAAAGRSRCGVHVTSQNATSDHAQVSCSRCIPRPSSRSGVVHLRWAPDPLAAHPVDRAMCNIRWAAHFSDDPKTVTCGVCLSRWSPVCRYCHNEKPSREPCCKRPECRRQHRQEMMQIGRRSTAAPTPEA